jgi:hypothetical protein
MNKLLLFFFMAFSLGASAQVGKIKIKKEPEKKEKASKPEVYHHGSLELYYGNRVYDKSYYNQVNCIDKIDLKIPPSFVGIGVSGYPMHITTLGGSYNNNLLVSELNYYKIIPSQITIEDSLSTKLSGYVFGAGVGPSLSTRRKRISLTAYIGFNTGRTTLSKNEFITQKNQFFSPKITLQPKFIIKRIAISFMLEAEYDVSNPAWRQTVFERKELRLLQPFHQTCYTALVCLGYKFY